MKALAFTLLLTTAAVARTDFWAPVAPPRAHYTIEAKFIPDASRLEGTETIRFRNDTRRPIGRVALDWYGEILGVRANGAGASGRREDGPDAHVTGVGLRGLVSLAYEEAELGDALCPVLSRTGVELCARAHCVAVRRVEANLAPRRAPRGVLALDYRP